MRSRRFLTAVLAVVTASSIGLVVILLRNGDERETAGGKAPGTSVAADRQRGLLVVDQYLARPIFTEGALPYIKVESADGRVIAEQLLRDTRSVLPLLRVRLGGGVYRLVSYRRPCEGACPRQGERGLDPPTRRCEATVEVAPRETVTALIRPGGGRGCRVVIGERIGPVLARRQGLAACRRIADDRDHSLRYWARDWGATSTRPEDLGAAYAATIFRGFEASIREAAAGACAEGIQTVEHPIRFVLEDLVSVGETVKVSITNVGTRAYLYEAVYQACFLSYSDSSGRPFIIPPGTHCDILGKVAIRPGETKRLFTWSLDECVKDEWGCSRSRSLPPGTYTIEGRFRPAAGGAPVQAVTAFEIVAA
jgi:hypothetical protein